MTRENVRALFFWVGTAMIAAGFGLRFGFLIALASVGACLIFFASNNH